MSSKHANRTARRLLQIASLGLAGLLAGLLAGCSASPKTVGMTSYAYGASTGQLDSATSSQTLDSRSTPPLRHAPSARRLEAGSVRLSSPTVQNPGL
jgi:uncharacterized lipoprotein YajG